MYAPKRHLKNMLKHYRDIKGPLTIIIESLDPGGTQQVVLDC